MGLRTRIWLWWHKRRPKKYLNEVYRRSYVLSSALGVEFCDQYRHALDFFCACQQAVLSELYHGLAISVRALDMTGVDSREIFLAMMLQKGSLWPAAAPELQRMPVDDLRRLLLALERL